MCGIAGAYHLQGGPIPSPLLDRMLPRLFHRGPDEEGRLEAEGFCLGIRRLSIMDPQGGQQPIYDESRRWVVVCNGEVVNFKEIRAELEPKGHRFRTRSDAEAVVHLFEEEGPASFGRLQGMFAFALGRTDGDQLYLVRDPFGIKPLYYLVAEGVLYFASEIKPLLAVAPGKPALHLPSLSRHLLYLYDPTEETVYRGIRKLLPGHFLSASRGRLEIRKYFDWRVEEVPASFAQARASCEALLQESLAKHLRCDVPLGFFVSGGIDSSLLLSLSTRLLGKPQLAFSVGFPGQGIYDESPYAKEAAAHAGAFHYHLNVEMEAQDLAGLARILEEPVADASAIPFLQICRWARERVKCCLSGLGGDEVFGGYLRYGAGAYARWLRLLPAGVRRSLDGLLGRVASDSTAPLGDKLRLVKKFLRSELNDPLARYLTWNTFFQTEMQRDLFARGAQEAIPSDGFSALRQKRESWADHHIRLGQLADLYGYLPGDTLHVADRCSMACGLEVRVPFLYVPLVQKALSFSPEHHLRGVGQTKRVLRSIAADYLPASLVTRPKHGFAVPVDAWLRDGWGRLFTQCFARERVEAKGLFRYEAIRELLRTHRRGLEELSQHLYQLLLFDLLHDQFFYGVGCPS